ncbi:replication initiation protein RepC [uncultured Aliiroseovarius sp.]|uniref:replication initiation protein RepC n=1 Tax=uncultured Aliiroseovarius sp. TaxID=1658783 RepID=UPI002632A177|nr:replication initiation protein RepC [uncultured Aliiroseovarius sp.]
MTDRTFPTLPQGHQRFSVEQLLIELAPALGLRGARLHALLYMMKQTAPGDWTAPDREPVFFAPQDQTAEALNKTRRALYDDEAALEAAGLIEKRVKGNGSRSPFGGCGIVFSKLIALVPDLLHLKEQMAAERFRRKELRNRRSTYVRHIKRHLRDAAADELTHPRLLSIIEAFDAWPVAARLASMPIEALERHVSEAQALCTTLDDFLETRPDSTAKAAENFPCFIQENNQDSSSVICNAGVDERSAGKPAHMEFVCSEPIGPEDCLEKKHEAERAAHNNKFIAQLTPERIFNLASNDMQSYILACQDDTPTLREIHIIDAATRIIHPLGINHDAWIKAVSLMGDVGAALCVLLIDANRNHPSTPIRNPGGALRAMTDRYKSGKLNLVGSLIGLARRRGF